MMKSNTIKDIKEQEFRKSISNLSFLNYNSGLKNEREENVYQLKSLKKKKFTSSLPELLKASHVNIYPGINIED